MTKRPTHFQSLRPSNHRTFPLTLASAAVALLAATGCSSPSPQQPQPTQNTGQEACKEFWLSSTALEEAAKDGDSKLVDEHTKKMYQASIGGPAEITRAASELSDAWAATSNETYSETNLRAAVNARHTMGLACQAAGFPKPETTN